MLSGNPGTVADGGNLRHSDTGDDAGGTDGTGADADLDRINTGLYQSFGSLGSSNVAGNDLQSGIICLGSSDSIDYPLRVAVGRIDDDSIDTGLDQRLDSGIHVSRRTDSGADAEPTE